MIQILFRSLFVPKSFLAWAPSAYRMIYVLSICVIAYALNAGLRVPPDITQGELFRIIYVHVPVAFFSLSLYVAMVLFVILERLLHLKMADVFALSSAFVGALMTVLALITGSIWAKPTWGTWWVWDARITSEVILLCLYSAYLVSRLGIKPRSTAIEIASWIAILGLLDLPLIHYSVQWWYTLHQGPTVLQFAAPKMPWLMLFPLIISIVGFALIIVAMMFHTAVALLAIHRARLHQAQCSHLG